MTDDYDIEREEAQFEHDMEQIDRIAELERVNSEYMDINHDQGMQLIESHKRIAELENAYSLLQAQFDITRERWMKRGKYIAKQRERIDELESLVRDMYADYQRITDGGRKLNYEWRMEDLGLTEVER